MQRISVHISDEIKKRINITAKAKNKTQAALIRDALEVGLESISPKSKSAQALLDLARMAEQLPDQPGDPKDISRNHDYYAWGGKNNNE